MPGRTLNRLGLEAWFEARGWEPLRFQREAWAAHLEGESGLIHAPTGVGKTLAAWGGPLLREMHDPGAVRPGIRVLWITPLRALARDTVANLQEPLDGLGLAWRAEHRMGDTSSSLKARQRREMPEALVTTPESLSLLLSYPETRSVFQTLHTVVVDEWHELMGSKRGVQVELGLARLRRWTPGLQTWGLSATLGNLEEARNVLLGSTAGEGRVIHGPPRPPPEIVTLVPERMERFPWAGHIGLALLPQVVEVLDRSGSTLLFTNTRSQAEIWHRAILQARPEWEGDVLLHHGSLDKRLRREAEDGLAEGRLRGVEIGRASCRERV